MKRKLLSLIALLLALSMLFGLVSCKEEPLPSGDSGETNSGETNSGETNSGETNSGDTNDGGTNGGGTNDDGTNDGGTSDDGTNDSATPTAGLRYSLNEDEKTYCVADIGETSDTEIVIASVYSGKYVTKIGNSAFKNCAAITSVAIPAKVTYIGADAFLGCSTLSNILFAGTKAEWLAIEKEYGWAKDTENFTVRCFDGALTKAECMENEGDASANNTVYIVVENYGIIAVELNPEEAPITVANFKKLVREGFYDGLTFHRVIQSFMIQGGDPDGDGTGGSDEEITGEFSANRIENNIKHVRGTISMARLGHPYESYHNAGYMNIPYSEREPYYNSASSQFFIVTETSESNTKSLDGNYAAFGQVTEGMEVVDAIAAVQTNASDKPMATVTIAKITFDRDAAEDSLGEDLGGGSTTIGG